MPVLQQRVGQSISVPWGEFAAQAPELAAFGALRLAAVPAYLATVDDSGAPRVHPVTPIVVDRPVGRLSADDLRPAVRDEATAYVCGSHAFADAMTDLLQEVGVDPSRIRVERFGPTG